MDWQVLLTTFGLVFIAELGDKTQLAVVTQTCKYRHPWAIFAGGSLALIAVTALGAISGQILGNFIPQNVIHIIAAIAFVVMGVLIWYEARTSCDEEADSGTHTEYDKPELQSNWNWQAFGATFSLLFLAELGDKTQLAVLGLASKQAMPWAVFIGGSLALTTVTALGVVGGQQLCKWIPEKLLLKISSIAFIVMGLLMAIGVL